MGWRDAPVVSQGPAGLLVPGNLDLGHRPRVRNSDGSVSTVRSISVNMDGREVLIPTVSDDGRVMSNQEAVQAFQRTGKHLGMFDTPANATAYAQHVHNDQAAMIEKPAGGSWRDAPMADAPQGVGAPLAGAGVTETPWYDRPIGSMGIPGILPPGGVAPGHGPSVRDVLATLPAAGGAAGGTIGFGGGTVLGVGVGGVPGAVGGAALGGGLGEAARQQIGDVIGIPKPQTAGARAKDIGTEAAIQGGAELGGRALAGGAKALGRGMVENAVRPPITLRREFPAVIDTIVKERLPVGAGPFGKVTGSQRAAARLAEESGKVRELLAKATAGGKTFETSKLAEPARRLLDTIADQPLSNADRAGLEGMLDEFLKKKGPLNPTDVRHLNTELLAVAEASGISAKEAAALRANLGEKNLLTPLEVQKLKQAAQSIAKPIYKAVARGENVSADQALKARFNSAIATGAKGAMETIPGVAEGEATKRGLIGAQRALSQAEMRRLPLMAEAGAAVVGSAAGQLINAPLDSPMERSAAGWLIARGLLSPRTLSRVGLTLTTAEAAAVLRQAPRLGAYLLRNAGTGPPSQTGATAHR